MSLSHLSAIERERMLRAVAEDDISYKASVESLYELMKAVMVEVDAMLEQPELKGCMDWMEEYFDGAWSKSTDRLDAAFAKTRETGEPRWAEAEAALHLAELRIYTARYRDLRSRLEVRDLLKDLGR